MGISACSRSRYRIPKSVQETINRHVARSHRLARLTWRSKPPAPLTQQPAIPDGDSEQGAPLDHRLDIVNALKEFRCEVRQQLDGICLALGELSDGRQLQYQTIDPPSPPFVLKSQEGTLHNIETQLQLLREDVRRLLKSVPVNASLSPIVKCRTSIECLHSFVDSVAAVSDMGLDDDVPDVPLHVHHVHVDQSSSLWGKAPLAHF